MGRHSRCVHDAPTRPWEADLASRAGIVFAFWAWYQPADMIRHGREQHAPDAGGHLIPHRRARPDAVALAGG